MIRKTTAAAALLIAGFTGHGAALAADFNVAAALANVPFEFEDAEGKVVGFEVDLVKLIAKRMNKTVEFSMMPFNSLFAAVQSGRANIAIGSIGITKKRLESVAFTQPIQDSDACLTVTTKSGIKNFEGLAGKQIAVLTGTTGEMWATANEAKYKFTGISRYDGTNEPMLDLATGRMGGFIQDCPIVKYYVKDKPQYTVVTNIPTNEVLGLMLAKNSPLLGPVNATISALKQDGELAKLYEKWFGSPAPKDSSTVAVKPIPR